MPEAVVAAARDAEQILVASERRAMLVGAGGIDRTRLDESPVEQHSADLTAARIHIRTARRRLEVEQREHAAETEVGDVRSCGCVAVGLVRLAAGAGIAQPRLVECENDQHAATAI